MSSPAHLLNCFRRGRARFSALAEARLQKARPGSVLILVVALLVLLALMGTAFISTSRTDRSSSAQNTFNTEIDLLVQGVCAVVQQQILASPGGPNDPVTSATQNTSPMMYTALAIPKSTTPGSGYLASRTPAQDANSGTVYWPQISAPAIAGAPFESPYRATPSASVTYGSPTANNYYQPTFITIQTPSGPQMYPALTDGTGNKWLAGSASGTGIADSGLVRLPIGTLNGITYYFSAFTIDNSSAVNASIAYQPNDATAPLPGDFSPVSVDLMDMLRTNSASTASQQMTLLNQYRWGNTSQASLAPIYDAIVVTPANPNGVVTPVAMGWTFNSPLEAMWMQLGRRLDNPGFNTTTVRYQTLSMSESAALSHRYCLMNPAASPSLLETYLAASLTTTDANGTVPVRTTPYSPDQAQQFFKDNFIYENNGGNLRPLIVSRNQVSSVAPSLFKNRGAWDATATYAFGDWVVGSDGASYVALQDNVPAGTTGAPTVSTQFWAQEPWIDYPVKTVANTATFGQLWLGYWSVMSAAGPDTPETAALPLFRNPIRGDVQVNGSAPGNSSNPNSGGGRTWQVNPTGGDDTGNIRGIINQSSPGDTIAFAAGNYIISSTLNLKPDRKYYGGGTPSVTGIAALSVPQTVRLRAALAAMNIEQLRGDNTSILTRQIGLGNVTIVPTGTTANTGGATLSWAAGNPGNDGPELAICNGGTTTEFTGFTVTGCDIGFRGGAVRVHGNTFQNSRRGLFIPDVHDSHFNNNTFSHVDEEGMTSYVNGRSGLSIASNNTFDNNTFDYVLEPIHVWGSASSGLDISNNIITHTIRHGMEIQNAFANVTINNNWISDFVTNPDGQGDHMAISAAIGGMPPGGGPDLGKNITISGNTALMTAPDRGKHVTCAIEIMGDQNISIANNYVAGWYWGVLNGATGAGANSANNIYICDVEQQPDGVGWGTIAWHSSGDRWYANNDPNQPAWPAKPASVPADTNSSPTTQPVSLPQAYRVTVYGTGQQPYITEVFANNDQATQSASNQKGGFVAVSIYNPYGTAISLKNWQWGTVNRSAGISSLAVTPLPTGNIQMPQTVTDLSSFLPTSLGGAIGPYQRLLFVSDSNMPTGLTADTSVAATVVIPTLNTALNSELILVRPRNASGALQSTATYVSSNQTYTGVTDANNIYDEVNNLSDLVPVDCYDFTNLPQTPSQDDKDSAEWHYVRPSNGTPDGKPQNWTFVYPYTYDIKTADNTAGTPPAVSANPAEPIPVSRLFATLVTSGGDRFGSGSPPAIALGAGNSAPADKAFANKGFSIQINNTDFGGPKASAVVNQYPFGGFARNGDLLQTTFIGSYRIDVLYNNPDGTTSIGPVEYSPVTMDSAFADDQIDADNTAENVGRFTPMNLIDSAGKFNDYDPNYTTTPPGVTPATTIPSGPYHFAMRLYDFLTVAGPADDYMSTNNGGAQTGAVARSNGIANVKPKYINAYPIPGMPTTEDNAPIDGLININTAPWRVLATLNMADNITDNETLAKAIVQYRDFDRGDGAPHGPFKNILELNGVMQNGVPIFSRTLATRAGLNNFDTTGTDRGTLDGDLAPFAAGTNDQVRGDFKKQFLAFNRISNLITTRADSFTTYILVQGWRNAGSATPELIVQRRAAFISDRSIVTPSNRVMNITNIPAN
jgi:hypothetical protein